MTQSTIYSTPSTWSLQASTITTTGEGAEIFANKVSAWSTSRYYQRFKLEEYVLISVPEYLQRNLPYRFFAKVLAVHSSYSSKQETEEAHYEIKPIFKRGSLSKKRFKKQIAAAKDILWAQSCLYHASKTYDDLSKIVSLECSKFHIPLCGFTTRRPTKLITSFKGK